jgi:transposase
MDREPVAVSRFPEFGRGSGAGSQSSRRARAWRLGVGFPGQSYRSRNTVVGAATSPDEFDRHLYKERHLVKDFFCKLKQFRAIATRYDKTARNFLAAIHLAAAILWLN